MYEFPTQPYTRNFPDHPFYSSTLFSVLINVIIITLTNVNVIPVQSISVHCGDEQLAPSCVKTCFLILPFRGFLSEVNSLAT